ncbi:hypothetical protein VKT23_010439 [Stygiomarasmius scandens]|uniref:Autophagy-related protein 27 n=1 Tax=Marasmiellus scandens TaxID=2682957 RepID=A0ABR1JBM9_9AGAR
MTVPSRLLVYVLASCYYVSIEALASPESLFRSSGSSSSLSSTRIACEFQAGSYLYNFCPLLQRRRTFEVPSTGNVALGTDREGSYTFRTGLADDHLSLDLCPEDALICWNDPNTSTSVTVAESVVFTGISRLSTDDVAPSTPEPFILELNGTVHNAKLQSTRIRFICDESIDEPRAEISSLPSFTGSYDGVHSFEWRSSHACPREYGQTEIETASADDEKSENPDSDGNKDGEDNKDGDGDNLVNPVPPYSARRRAAIIIIVIGLIALTTLIDTCLRPSLTRISPYLPSFHLHLPTLSSHTFENLNIKNIKLRIPSLIAGKRSRRRRRAMARPFRFRVGENRLVQWANEDSRLIGEGGEAFDFEEDYMVNGLDVDTENDDLEGAGARGEFGEYVPLSAGMGWGRKDYGTAGSKV